MPDLPLASDPNLDLTGFLYRSLEFLRKELSYSGSYKPDSNSIKPASLSEPTAYAPPAAPVREQPSPDLAGLEPQPPMAGGTPGSGPTYQQAVAPQASAAQAANPWQHGVPGAQPSLNTSSPSQAPAQYSAYQTPNTPGNATRPAGLQWRHGSPDLQSPSFNPGLLGGSGASWYTAGSQHGAATGERRVSKPSQRSKS
jgi:hypothetical protein